MPEESPGLAFLIRRRFSQNLALSRRIEIPWISVAAMAISAAQIVSGTVYAMDTEPEMIAATQAKAMAIGLGNVRTLLPDFACNQGGQNYFRKNCPLRRPSRK
jgi:hypothetical protein